MNYFRIPGKFKISLAILLIVVLVLFHSYFAIFLKTGALMFVDVRNLIFHPEKTIYETPEDYGLFYERVDLEMDEGLHLNGWFIPAKDAEDVVLFLHGNAGNISGRLQKAIGWLNNRKSVFLLDYRGYGLSQGQPESDEDFVKDAKQALSWLHKKGFENRNIILHGESLGSYPAVRLATQYPVQGLMLEAPFLSFVKLAPVHYPVIPKFVVSYKLKSFQFDNEKYISKVIVPIFIIHGTSDKTCPFEMGESLFEDAPEPKEFFKIPGGSHAKLYLAAKDEFWRAPLKFFNEKHA